MRESKNSQGRDPKTFEENSQRGDAETPSKNTQGKDPSTFEGRSHQVERFRDLGKRKEEK